MKNKGVTLIDLLATVIILGILAAITTIGVTKYINLAKTSSYNHLVVSINEAAELYVTDNSGLFEALSTPSSTFDITLQELVDNDYLKDNIVDPRNDSVIPLTTKVTITVVSLTKITTTFDY